MKNLNNDLPSPISDNEFEEMKNIVFSNIEKAATDISNGDFPIKPYKPIKADKSPCVYCELRSVCAKSTNVLD